LVHFECYRSRDALDEHRGSAHYVSYRAQLAGMLTKRVEVTVLAPIDEAD